MTDLAESFQATIRQAVLDAAPELMDEILERIEEIATEDPRQLVSIEQMAEESPISEGALRKLVWRRERNGLLDSGAVVEIGRRKYLNRRAFYKYLKARTRTS